MVRMNNVLMVGLVLLISTGAALGVPVSDGSLFDDDFGTGDLSKWNQITTSPSGVAEYDGAVGNPAGSFHVATGTWDEGFGRPNILDGTGATEVVTEFDIKVNDSCGDSFLIWAAYTYADGTGLGASTDLEIQMKTNDWVGDYPGGPVWDIHVYEADWVLHSLQTRLDADEWHHFVIHRKSLSGPDNVDLYIDNNLIGTYDSLSPGGTGIVGDAQIGDVSTGAMWGNANWDNFLIGGVVPEPATMVILLAGSVLAIRRRKRA